MMKSYLGKCILSRFILVIVLGALSLTGCAYHLGSPDRSLPGGYRQVFVPIFKNKSQEPSIEVFFTNSLIQEFERGRVGRVVDSSQAEVIAEGTIDSVSYSAGGISAQNSGATLAAQYQILVQVNLVLRRNSDKSVLWQGSFSGERTYVAPQVTATAINTVNPLYNQSARRQNMEVVASSMMSEAHDRLTENF